MKRSISMSLAGVAAATTLVAGIGTTAVFSDVEQSSNEIQSGTLDLQIGHTDGRAFAEGCDDGTVLGDTVLANFDSGKFAPGDTSPEKRICMQNVGNLDGTVTITVPEVNDEELTLTSVESCTEPELVAEQAALADSATQTGCGTSGELEQWLRLTVNNCSDASQVYDGPIAGFEFTEDMAAGAGRCLTYRVTFDSIEGDQNVAQSDVVSWNFQFDFAQRAGMENTTPAADA